MYEFLTLSQGHIFFSLFFFSFFKSIFLPYINTYYCVEQEIYNAPNTIKNSNIVQRLIEESVRQSKYDFTISSWFTQHTNTWSLLQLTVNTINFNETVQNKGAGTNKMIHIDHVQSKGSCKTTIYLHSDRSYNFQITLEA